MGRSKLNWRKKNRRNLKKGCFLQSPVNYKGPILRSSTVPSNEAGVDDANDVSTQVDSGRSRPITRSLSKQMHKEKSNNRYFITHKGKMQELINNSIRQHREHGPCEGDLEMVMANKLMLSNSVKMRCTVCDFENDSHKLYREQISNKPGRKSSTLNLALGASLVGSSIQAAQATEIFLGLGISPGSEAGINNAAAKAGDIIENLADKSMDAEIEALEGEEDGIDVSSDCFYNNPLGGDPNNPNPRGTTRVGTLIYHPRGKNKGKHKMLGMKITTKFCNKSYAEMRKGRKPLDCPNHPGCTATIGQDHSISVESEDMPYYAEKLKKVKTRKVVTDGDTSMGNSISDNFGDDTKHEHDFRHVSKSTTRALNNLKLSNGAFGDDVTTQKERSQIQSKFMADLTWRTNAEIGSRVQKLSEELVPESDEFYVALADSLAEIPRICIKCVSNECGDACTENSDICIGGLNRKLKRHLMGDRKLNFTENDILKMERLLITKKTGQTALEDSLPSSSTQVNESANRAIIKRVPKTVTYTRTLSARVKRYALDMNTGVAAAGLSISEAIQHHVDHTVENHWHRIESKRLYLKNRKKDPRIKRERRTKYIMLNEMHREKQKAKKKTKKASTKANNGEYQTGIELDQPTSKPSTSRDTA